MDIVIDGRHIGNDHPTYFIADIAANHDGSLDRARALIRAAHEAGADAAKFQHFDAPRIVSDVGFRRLDGKLSHQAAWTKPVTEVYREASVPPDWTPILAAECERVGITFFSSPYDTDAVDALEPYVPAYKVGSGDIDWIEALEYIAAKGKPVIIGTGAATMAEVERAVERVLAINAEVIVLQCNTNYTADEGNFDHLNLRAITSYQERWPELVVGLSDHTHGPAAVLGAVALGARVIERHFTDDNSRPGPDHTFALDPDAWAAMVTETRRLERALGSAKKFVTANEVDSAVVQRRCVRAGRDLRAGDVLTRDDLDVLRPATPGAIGPADVTRLAGLTLLRDVAAGNELRWDDLSPS